MGVFCEYLWENEPRYNGTALYFVENVFYTSLTIYNDVGKACFTPHSVHYYTENVLYLKQRPLMPWGILYPTKRSLYVKKVYYT